MRCGAVVVGLVAIAACGDGGGDEPPAPTDRIDDDIARLAGLVGSTQVAKGLAGTDVVAVHTVDQVGWDEDGDQVLEIERPTDALYAEYEAAADELAMAVRRTDTGGTDHVAFRDRGYAAAGVTEEYAGGDTTPHRHEPGDTYDTVDVDYAIAAARLVTRVVSREVAAESWRP